MDNLRSRTIRSALWHFSGTGGRLAVQILVQICLARLLSPTDFGLMAMLAVVTGISQILIEGGFGLALIHRKEATCEEESSVLYCNTALACGIAALLWIVSPWVALFYGQAELSPLLRLSGLGLVAGALGIVHNSVLTRRMDFKSLAMITLLAGALSGGIAIWMACIGFGVWSLAWQMVLGAVFRTTLLWMRSKWRPVLRFDRGAVQKMGAYGSRLAASSIVSTLCENLNQVLIGKFYSPVDLGYFTRAQFMQGIPVNTFSQAVAGVALPAFVHLNDKPQEFRQGYRRAIQCTMALSAPMVALLFILAKPIFFILLSSKWMPSVPYFQIFCVAGLLYPMHLLNINTLLALGRTDLYFRIEVLKRLVTLATLAAGLPFGVIGIALATVANSYICLIINCHYTKTLVGYSLSRQILDVVPYVACAICVAAVTWSILRVLPGGMIPQALAGTLVFVLGMFLGSFLIPGNIYLYLWRTCVVSLQSKQA